MIRRPVLRAAAVTVAAVAAVAVVAATADAAELTRGEVRAAVKRYASHDARDARRVTVDHCSMVYSWYYECYVTRHGVLIDGYEWDIETWVEVERVGKRRICVDGLAGRACYRRRTLRRAARVKTRRPRAGRGSSAGSGRSR